VRETRDPEALRAEIEETRRELGETVAALSAKTDVKAQAKGRIEDVKHTAQEKRDELLGRARQISPDGASAAASTGTAKVRENPLPVAAAGAFLAGFVVGRVSGRRGG
jgi:hypothetical protein